MRGLTLSIRAAYSAFCRDAVFNRGPTGGAKILQMAINQESITKPMLVVDGHVGRATKTKIGCEFSTNDTARSLLHAMRNASENYELNSVGKRDNLWKGLVNRWNNRLNYSLTFL